MKGGSMRFGELTYLCQTFHSFHRETVKLRKPVTKIVGNPPYVPTDSILNFCNRKTYKSFFPPLLSLPSSRPIGLSVSLFVSTCLATSSTYVPTFYMPFVLFPPAFPFCFHFPFSFLSFAPLLFSLPFWEVYIVITTPIALFQAAGNHVLSQPAMSWPRMVVLHTAIVTHATQGGRYLQRGMGPLMRCTTSCSACSVLHPGADVKKFNVFCPHIIHPRAVSGAKSYKISISMNQDCGSNI